MAGSETLAIGEPEGEIVQVSGFGRPAWSERQSLCLDKAQAFREPPAPLRKAGTLMPCAFGGL